MKTAYDGSSVLGGVGHASVRFWDLINTTADEARVSKTARFVLNSSPTLLQAESQPVAARPAPLYRRIWDRVLGLVGTL
jgi:hypothetical protein